MKIKKFKIFGEKDDFKGFIAELYLENDKLIVESQDEQLKKDLSAEINKHIANDEFFYINEGEETELEHMQVTSRHKPGDPRFLEALAAEFWPPWGKFSNKTFGGYRIKGQKTELIEE